MKSIQSSLHVLDNFKLEGFAVMKEILLLIPPSFPSYIQGFLSDTFLQLVPFLSLLTYCFFLLEYVLSPSQTWCQCRFWYIAFDPDLVMLKVSPEKFKKKDFNW